LELKPRSLPDSYEAYSSFFDMTETETEKIYSHCKTHDKKFFKQQAASEKSLDDKIKVLQG
jgi:hypothetical protein